MVHARSVERHGELHAFAGAELAGVNAHTQPAGRARREHTPRLFDRERAGLAEDVDPAGVRRAGVEHGARDEVDVGVGVVGVLGRNDVGAEEGDLVGDGRRDRDEPRLVVDTQPVAALDLDGRRALPVELADEPLHPRAQLRIPGRAGRRHRAADPAGRVRQARHARLELRRAVSREHQVAVRIHEPGNDGRAAQVGDDVGLKSRRGGGGCRPHPRNAAVLDQHRGIRHQTEPVDACRAGIGRVVGDELADAGEEFAGHAAQSSIMGTRRPRSRATSAARS